MFIGPDAKHTGGQEEEDEERKTREGWSVRHEWRNERKRRAGGTGD